MVDPATGSLVVLLGGILVVLVVALRRRDYAAAINAALSFFVTVFPFVVEASAPRVFGGSVVVGLELPLWIAITGLLHSIGMLGPYDTIWWWDVLTHVLAAGLVAALVFAGLLVSGVSTPIAVVLTIALTLAAGVFWELIELLARDVGERYDVEPVLVHYGWRDTAFDIVFDVVGALFVVLLDLRIFVPIAEQASHVTRILVVGSGVVLVGGSVVLTLAVLQNS